MKDFNEKDISAVLVALKHWKSEMLIELLNGEIQMVEQIDNLKRIIKKVGEGCTDFSIDDRFFIEFALRNFILEESIKSVEMHFSNSLISKQIIIGIKLQVQHTLKKFMKGV
jgi:hypothetical protein